MVDPNSRNILEDARFQTPWNSSFYILSLSGGGFRGIFTAHLLSKIEEQIGRPIRDLFDLIIGTSTGSLIAAGLCAGKSAKDLDNLYLKIGPTIFSSGPAFLQRLGLSKAIVIAKRAFFTEPYQLGHLRSAIRLVLGNEVSESKLSDFSEKFVSVAVSYTHAELSLFGSRRFKARSDVSLEEAILASAAAPTFFSPLRNGEQTFIDGGLVANSPELVGINLARSAGHSLSNIRILSIGTASPSQGLAAEIVRSRSGFRWLVSRRGLVQITMAAQEHLATVLSKELLGERYVRIDCSPSSAQATAIGSMDNASIDAADTLRLLARRAWEQFEGQHSLGRYIRERP